jgi:Transposase, Mutator family
MKKVQVEEVASAGSGLPERVLEALGELVGAAKEGLLALSVGVGLGVLGELMAEEVEGVCGPRGRHDPERVAYRHGSDDGEVTLGGRRVQVQRPRVRAKDGGEVPLGSYEHFAGREVLSRVVAERMLAGVSTRRFVRTAEPVGEEVEAGARSTSKSSISRTFVQRTATTLKELMSRTLDDVRLAVLMLDGIELKGRTNVVALGITTEGVKIPLGLWEGSTENKTVATALLSDLVARGLDVEQGVLVVIDGSKALRAAVNAVLGPRTPVHRCVRHKECHGGGDVRGWGQPPVVPVRKEFPDAAVRWDRLGDTSCAMVRNDAVRRGHRRGLGAGGRRRPGVARPASGRRCRSVSGDDVECPRFCGHLSAWVCRPGQEGCGVYATQSSPVPGGVPS